jgi:hypothetical protein
MLAHLGISRILAVKGGRPVQCHDRDTGGLPEDVGRLGRERTLSGGQRAAGKEGGEQKSAQPRMIVVIEQWICLILGFACVMFGIWGICMKPEQDSLSAHIAWLGSLYMPTLRVTAVVCIGLGIMLARRGWAHL